MCGRNRRGADGRVEQWPCLDETNEARDKWARADGLHNIDDSKLGGRTNPPPYCKGHTSKPVNGM